MNYKKIVALASALVICGAYVNSGVISEVMPNSIVASADGWSSTDGAYITYRDSYYIYDTYTAFVDTSNHYDLYQTLNYSSVSRVLMYEGQSMKYRTFFASKGATGVDSCVKCVRIDNGSNCNFYNTTDNIIDNTNVDGLLQATSAGSGIVTGYFSTKDCSTYGNSSWVPVRISYRVIKQPSITQRTCNSITVSNLEEGVTYKINNVSYTPTSSYETHTWYNLALNTSYTLTMSHSNYGSTTMNTSTTPHNYAAYANITSSEHDLVCSYCGTKSITQEHSYDDSTHKCVCGKVASPSYLNINYYDEKLTGFINGFIYKYNNDTIEINADTSLASLMGTNINVVASYYGDTTDKHSNPCTIDIPERPNAPTITSSNATIKGDITFSNETIKGKHDGTITIPSGMEYKLLSDNVSNWTKTSSNTVLRDIPGNAVYQVRKSATNISFASKIAEITIQQGRDLVYTTKLNNVTSTIVEPLYKQQFTTNLTPNYGYKLSKSDISITVGDEPISSNDFTYYDGILTIVSEKVIEDIKVTAVANKVTLPVNVDLSNIKLNGSSFATMVDDYEATLTADEGYTLPKDINITVDGKQITNYKYSSTTGKISIPKDVLIGEVIISATAEKVEETTTPEVTTTSKDVTTTPEVTKETTNSKETTPTETTKETTTTPEVTKESTSTEITTTPEVTTTSKDVTTTPKQTTVSDKITTSNTTTKNDKIQVNTPDNIILSNDTIEIGQEYRTTLSTDDGFPEFIEVKVNGTLLSTNQYTYVDGELVIPAEYVTGDITIDVKSVDETTTITTVTTSNDNPSTTVLWGDIDGNNEIDARDVLLLKKYLLQMVTDQEVGTQGLSNADVTHDDEVTAPDLVKLKKYILTMITQDDLAVTGA